MTLRTGELKPCKRQAEAAKPDKAIANMKELGYDL